MIDPLLLKGGRLLDPEGDLPDRPPVADLLIEGGKVSAIGPEATERAAAIGAGVFDISDHLVTPGFVNAHSHSHDVLLRGMFEGLPLEAWGLYAFPSAWPRRPPAEIALRTKLHAVECLRNGITTVQDMVTLQGADRSQADTIIEAYAGTAIRVRLGLQFGDRAMAETMPLLHECLGPALLAALPSAVDPAPLQRLAESLLGTANGERLGWVLCPSAPQRCSDDLIGWAARLSRDRGLPVATHLYEARSQAVLARLSCVDDGGSMVRRMQRLGALDQRLIVAHGVWITEEEIDRLGAAGVHLACNPVANLRLLNGVAPVRRYADAGVGTALGCDNSSAGDAQSPFQAMRSFARHWSLQSPLDDGLASAAAYRAATLGGGRALGLAGEVGGLRPNHRADLLIFDLADPAWMPLNGAVRQLVHAEDGRSLRHILIGGEFAMRDSHLLGIDLAALAEQVEEARAAMANDFVGLTARQAELRDGLLRMTTLVRAHPLDIDRLRLD
jgi:cytosine/adenosine deaminase-related metal-dependent hydrolase